MRSIFRNRRRLRAERMARLLGILKQNGSNYVPARDLIAAMGIGAATYPLLAELDRTCQVERRWLGGHELAYRLTAKAADTEESQDTMASKAS